MRQGGVKGRRKKGRGKDLVIEKVRTEKGRSVFPQTGEARSANSAKIKGKTGTVTIEIREEEKWVATYTSRETVCRPKERHKEKRGG